MSNNFDNLIWQQNSNQSDNGDNLKAIANWWSGLAGKEVAWQQRLIPTSGNLEELDWQLQKFDDKLVLETPQVRGITLYWRNNQGADERNITPSKLSLNTSKQRLYVFPQSQSQVVISVSLPVTVYQKINLVNPQLAATIKNGQGIILLRDETEKLEIKVALSQSQINQLLDQFKIADNQ
ncbi:hypothetical protein C7B62_10190 [Pleurocapsa sp. CCALA 161]|uniref:hypothetical protein n=1 Tax=Pleurocapsa sp. CCALA 161 TaxID=2107688 RepID=UPI000D049350|nr:hypothetical protein [Pleurocapsa sp. CCALA 161]PSB10278.1 hypothetical protein C7B62_10190 [Pleurocapsa sp. CCALA 161]